MTGLVMLILLLSQLRDFAGIPFMHTDQLLILIALCVLAMKVCLTKKLTISSSHSKALILMVLMFIWLTFSTYIGFWLGTNDHIEAIRCLKDLGLGIMFFASLSLYPEFARQADKLWQGFLFMSASTVAVELVLYQVSSLHIHNILFTPPYSRVRLTGGFMGPNMYGAFLAMLFPALIMEAFINQGLKRLIAVFGMFFVLITIGYTGSRGAILGAVLGLLMLGIQFFFARKTSLGKRFFRNRCGYSTNLRSNLGLKKHPPLELLT